MRMCGLTVMSACVVCVWLLLCAGTCAFCVYLKLLPPKNRCISFRPFCLPRHVAFPSPLMVSILMRSCVCLL